MADASTVDLSEDRSGSLRAYTIGVTVLTFLAIGARFLGRLLIERGNRFWWDDWAALASVVSSTSDTQAQYLFQRATRGS
jgi:hypothetical protein